MSTISYKNGKLHMENVALETAAATTGTPLYCYSAEQIANNYHAWQNALAGVMPQDQFTICYACKANSNQAVVKLMAMLGAGADVVSEGEMYRAFRAGIPAGRMVFSGVGKNVSEITRAVKNGLKLINVESESELNMISKAAVQVGKNARIAFRVNPNVDAKTHAKITTGLRENKFGIDLEHAVEFYTLASTMPGIEITGVAVHIGSQLTDLAPFREAFICVAELVKKLRERGHAITTVDLGGGIGITYKDETPPDLKEYAALIREIILPLNVHVVVEPGRSIVGNAGVLLTRVLHEKKGEHKKFLIVDAAMNDLMRPTLYDAYHQVIPCVEPKNKETEKYDVVGPVCETGDTFLTDADMPAHSKQGDLFAIMCSGAYGAAMSSTYNTRPLVPEALISDDQVDLIRKPQTLQMLVDVDILPAWMADKAES